MRKAGAAATGRRALVAFAAAGLAATVTAAPAPADADPGRVVEHSLARAEVAVVMAPGHARVTVTRTYRNDGEHDGMMMEHWSLPEGAVLSRLGVKSRGGWISARPMEPDAALAAYFGAGGAAPSGQATLVTLDHGSAELWLYPFLSQRERSLRYQLLVPTRYRDGRHVIDNPAFQLENAHVEVTAPAGKLFADDDSYTTERARDASTLALEPTAPPPLSGALAMVPLASGEAIARTRLHVAPLLSTEPTRARVAILLDTSRSLAASDLAAARQAAHAYLDQLPDAQVAVWSFARRVEPITAGFVSATDAQNAIALMPSEQHNGSDVTAALATAHAALAALPNTDKAGPKRVLLFSDGLTASAIDAAKLANSLAPDEVLLHVAAPRDGYPSLARWTDHDWNDAVERTGGAMWRLQLEADAGARATEITEELVRPLRLHDVTVSPDAAGITRSELAEGEGSDALVRLAAPIAAVTVEAKLWGRTLSQRLPVSAAETQLWQSLVLASPLESELSDAEVERLARATGSLSRVTSLLAVEPGRRPEPYLAGIGLGGIGTSGRCGCRAGIGMRGTRHHHPDVIRGIVAEAAQHCRVDALSATIETTDDEIVAVAITSERASEGAAACVEEQLWQTALTLPTGGHVTWEIAYP